MDIKKSFEEACYAVGVHDKQKIDKWCNTLVDKYCEPWRHYHTLKHVEQLLTLYREHSNKIVDHACCVFSIWFHDAIYDPTRNDNEEESAVLWKAFCNDVNIDEKFTNKVEEFILATKSHKIADTKLSDVELEDLKLFLDFDVSILAAPPEEYDIYVKNVRLEYRHVTEEAWKKGRTAVLNHLLAGGLFLTNTFKELEPRAHDNIKREISSLSSSK